MLAPIIVFGSYGPSPVPGPGLTPAVGPIVDLAFVLSLGGPPPNVIQPPVPQTCQESAPNVALQVLVVDQFGIPVDVSAASLVQLWLLAPDQTVIPVPAAFVNNGMDGLIQFITEAGTLPQAGTWGIQASLQFGANMLETGWGYFAVAPNVGDL